MDPIASRVGWADFGDFEHFGVRLYRDLAGRVSYLQMVVFALGAGLLDPEDAAVLDDVASCCHVADPRIWPLKLARIVASAGRAITGHLAACVVLDGDFIGAHAAEAAALLLSEAHRRVGHLGDAEAAPILAELFAGLAAPPGFGLQARREDERVAALRTCLERRGRLVRPHWRVAEGLWRAGRSERGAEPNVFGAVAAACLDLGLGAPQIGALTAMFLQPSLLANAYDGAALRSPGLETRPELFVEYTGAPPRRSPRALAAAREREPEADLTRSGG